MIGTGKTLKEKMDQVKNSQNENLLNVMSALGGLGGNTGGQRALGIANFAQALAKLF